MKPAIRGLPGSEDLPELLTIDEAATHLRVSKNTVYRLLKTDQIGRLKIGSRTLIARSDVHEFLASAHTSAVAGTNPQQPTGLTTNSQGEIT